MELTEENVFKYMQYLSPQKNNEKLTEISNKWIKQSKAGERDLSNHFITMNDNQDITEAIYLFEENENTYNIGIPSTTLANSQLSKNNFIELVKEAIKKCREDKKIKNIFMRVVEQKNTKNIPEELKNEKFIRLSKRVEFKTNVAELPTSNKTPFQWTQIRLGDKENLKLAANYLIDAGDGMKEWGTFDENLVLLNKSLQEEEFLSHQNQLIIGHLNSIPAALLLIQITKDFEWTTISYISLAKEFRRKNFGQNLQQYAFKIMKDNNAKVYLGGTDFENKPMISLFEKNKCAHYRTIQEFNFNL